MQPDNPGNVIKLGFSLVWQPFEVAHREPMWLGRLRGKDGLVGLNPPCACVAKSAGGKFIGYTIKAPYSFEFSDCLTLDEAKQKICDVIKGMLPEIRLRMKEILDGDIDIWGWKQGQGENK